MPRAPSISWASTPTIPNSTSLRIVPPVFPMKLVLSTSLMGIVILASAGTTMRPQYSDFFNGGSDGLSAAEVAERVARGLVNDVPSAPTRTIGQIVRANVLTRFNLLLGSLLAVILVVGPRQDALFGLVIVANTLVGIVQELRAKRTLDRLEVVNAPRPGWCATGGGRAGRRPGRARRRARGRRRRPGGGRRRGAGGGRAGGRRVAAHRRVRDGGPPARRPAAGQLRGRRERPLPGHQGRPGGLRGPAHRGGPRFTLAARAAGRGRPDPQVRPGRWCRRRCCCSSASSAWSMGVRAGLSGAWTYPWSPRGWCC